MANDSSRISPTAHYISYLKHRGGLSAAALTTGMGRVLHHGLWPMMSLAHRLGRFDVQDIIVARHRGLDHFLHRAIEDGAITQVIEIAAGLSPRGHAFMRRHADRGLIYVEGDLAEIAGHKREALAKLGPLAPGHHIVELDALLDSGPTSLAGVSARLLDRGGSTAVIYEGLAPYIDRAATLGLWQRIHAELSTHARARLITEVYFMSDVEHYPLFRVIRGTFSALVRGRLHLDFADHQDVAAELARVGFASVQIQHLRELVDELQLDVDPEHLPVHLIDAELGGSYPPLARPRAS